MKRVFIFLFFALPYMSAAQFCFDSIVSSAVRISIPEYRFYISKHSNGNVFLLTDSPFYLCNNELKVEEVTIKSVTKFSYYKWRKKKKNNHAIIISIAKCHLGENGSYLEVQVQGSLLSFKKKRKIIEPFSTVNFCLRFNDIIKKWEIMLC